MSSTAIQPTDDKLVCTECVGEAYLRQQIHDQADVGRCSYCDHEAPCMPLEELANQIERAFEDHFEPTPTEPEGWEWVMIKESDYEWERGGEEVLWAISEAAKVDGEIAEDVRAILEDRHADFDDAAMGIECPFSEESHYTRKEPGDGQFPYLWEKFERDLKTKARFFSRSAQATLNKIFGDVENIVTTGGKAAIVDAGPDTEIDQLVRARTFQNEEPKLLEALSYPWRHLGTPPTEFARAGRMNASGIAVFYGAIDPETALAEVRPPVGSDVAVTRFNILRPLRLLDLRALTSVDAEGSIFDPSTLVGMQRAGFLKILSQTMSRAIMPHEEESEYLTTQAVAEYLATEASLDGIMFPSVQAGSLGTNVVLFHHAARVEEVELPPEAKIESGIYIGDPDNPSLEYYTWEKFPAAEIAAEGRTPTENISQCADPDPNLDSRHPALAVELGKIEVHRIQSANYPSSSRNPIRARFTRKPASPESAPK